MAPNGHWDRHRSTSLSRGKADISDAHAWKFKHLCEFRILWSAGGFTAEYVGFRGRSRHSLVRSPMSAHDPKLT